MTIHPIQGAGVALYITPAELETRGLTVRELSAVQAGALARQACAAVGLLPEGELEIEAFPDRSGVLLFVRFRPPERMWFSFETLEPLFAAAQAGEEPPERCALYWCAQRWWLSLEGEAESWAARLSEFGRRERERPHLAAHLAEFGQTVFPCRALHELGRYAPARERA